MSISCLSFLDVIELYDGHHGVRIREIRLGKSYYKLKIPPSRRRAKWGNYYISGYPRVRQRGRRRDRTRQSPCLSNFATKGGEGQKRTRAR